MTDYTAVRLPSSSLLSLRLSASLSPLVSSPIYRVTSFDPRMKVVKTRERRLLLDYAFVMSPALDSAREYLEHRGHRMRVIRHVDGSQCTVDEDDVRELEHQADSGEFDVNTTRPRPPRNLSVGDRLEVKILGSSVLGEIEEVRGARVVVSRAGSSIKIVV